jgi:hypothetical protein
MSDELNDELESKTEPTEEVEKTEAVEDESVDEESEDLEVLQEKNKRLYERAKKAEAEAKLLKAERLKAEEQAKVKVELKAEPKPSEKQEVLTPMDAILLSKANITEAEDIEEIVNYANFRKIPVKDALKDKTMQTILKDREEQRQTAEATNTGAARRGSSKPTPEQLLANVSIGKLPDDPADLVSARFLLKKRK